jgi:hypothetical protein
MITKTNDVARGLNLLSNMALEEKSLATPAIYFHFERSVTQATLFYNH